MEPKLLTPEQVGDCLHVGRTRVYELLASGAIRSVKIGRLRRVPEECVREYVVELMEAVA
jgi:excisionase family DNA binding protein